MYKVLTAANIVTMVTRVFFTLPKPRRISWSELSFSRSQDEYPVLDRLSPENRTKVPKLIVFLQKTKRTSPSWSSFFRKRKSWCRLSFSQKRSKNPEIQLQKREFWPFYCIVQTSFQTKFIPAFILGQRTDKFSFHTKFIQASILKQ